MGIITYINQKEMYIPLNLCFFEIKYFQISQIFFL